MDAQTVVDRYIESQPEDVQEALQSVRSVVRKVLPEAQETIAYKIPAYRMHGRIVIYFAGWSQHYALYPANSKVFVEFEKELRPYETRKGTIRFPLSEDVPTKLIERIVKFCSSEAAARAKARKDVRNATKPE